MIFVDISDLHLPIRLKRKLDVAFEKMAKMSPEERTTFIKRNSSLWNRVKPYLTVISGRHQTDYKCWYCETKDIRSDYHVDHFRPKNRVKNKGCSPEAGYWWLAFDHTNYRLACSYCNSLHSDDESETRGKADQFPLEEGSIRASNPSDNLDDERYLLLDPTKPGDPGLLSFAEDGRIYSRYPKGTFACKKAEVSIEILNLNDVRIEEARKLLWRYCLRKVDQGTKEFARFVQNGSIAAKKSFDDICLEIIEMVAPHSEFSAMARYCFRGTGQDWVLALL
jgi:uncharacterized protein (TIGR02646 family)